MAKARTITETKDVLTIVNTLTTNHPRFEDGWEAWKWRLSRDPVTDALEFKDGLMLIKTDPNFERYGVPPITILYSFDENEVSIIAIKVNDTTT